MTSAASLTGHLDVAQLALYVFWFFFAGLIWYLHGENKREGYPLVPDRAGEGPVEGLPPVPAPKSFLLANGETVMAPRQETADYELKARPLAPWPGAPLQPTGNPMTDGVGPGAYAMRADVPDVTMHGQPRIVPMRAHAHHSVAAEDGDPRGMTVVGADRKAAGTVTDIWTDLAETVVRYLEVTLAGGTRTVLLPMNFAVIDRKRRTVKVESILARHFTDVPSLSRPDVVTLREEDRITAYYGSGHLYATPQRLEPAL